MIRAAAVGLIAALFVVSNGHAQDGVTAAGPSPVVVELFTAQGCPSCPAADRVLADLAARPDVLALSFHVTYWDGLGWKDQFGSPENTKRQKAYRRPLKNDQIYTPQMVIGGKTEVPGHDARTAVAVITHVAQTGSPGPNIKLSRSDKVTVEVAQANGVPASTVWIAAYIPKIDTAVKRGKNAGKSMPSSNVVRAFVALGPYTGDVTHFEAPPNFANDGEGIAVWLQTNPMGTILAAANLSPVSP